MLRILCLFFEILLGSEQLQVIYNDTTEQQLTERMQGADEDAGIWKAQFEDEHWKIWRSFCIIFTNLT